MDFEQYRKQITEAGRRAHYNTSFSPEKRGEQEFEGFCGTCEKIIEQIDKLQLSEEIKAVEKTLFVETLFNKEMQYLRIKSNCISSMITGRSNFPVRRAERANQAEHNASEAYMNFVNNYIKKLEKKHGIDFYSTNVIKKEDSDAVEKLKKKIETLEKMQSMMIEANKIVRKYKTNEERKAEFLKIGFSEKTTDEILTPNGIGGIGFMRFELTNNGATIRTAKQRLEQIEKLKSQKTVEFKAENGIRLEDNPAENRIRIFYNGKPPAETISELKHHAFRWTPSLGCWQAYRNNRSIEFAKQQAGIK
jgi:hypothetical protein